jgi:hypothetical protein
MSKTGSAYSNDCFKWLNNLRSGGGGGLILKTVYEIHGLKDSSALGYSVSEICDKNATFRLTASVATPQKKLTTTTTTEWDKYEMKLMVVTMVCDAV